MPHIAATIIKTDPPDWCMPSKGDCIKASKESVAVTLANHLPFLINGDKNIARADRKARVAIVSAMTLPHTTDPLALHKQEE
tara:strand:- start:108 stop:353 length:246 start_codon:yes stop_codon:yes gene_type:complete